MRPFRSPWRQLSILAVAFGAAMAVRRLLRQDPAAARPRPLDDQALDEALEDSFPASDPPALSVAD